MKKNGFTLIEMVIALAVSSLIVVFLSMIIWQSIKAYNIVLENNDISSKIDSVIKRIEDDLYESNGNITAVYSLASSITSFAGIRISGNFGTHSYFWDNSGNGNIDTVENNGPANISKAIYRVSGTAIDILMTSNGNIPSGLNSKYGSTWNSYSTIKNFYFSFYREEPAGSGKHVLWKSNESTPGAIKFVLINVDIEGVKEKTNFKFSTGIKIK